jgi:type II secretory pathway pseudopilin PulG
MQAAQQAAQLSVQATQQANQQMQQAAQTAQQQMQQDAANASTQMPAPRRGLARADKPQFSPRSGKYVAGTTVTLQDDIPKATIFYTTDSSEPTTSSAVYTGPIVLNASMRLRAIAKSPIYSASRVSKANYIVK